MRDRSAIAVLGALVCALSLGLLVSGCGGAKKGVDGRTADELVSSATKAIGQVRSVRVSGSVAGAKAHSIRLDLRLVAGRGAVGSMSENGLSFRLVTIGTVAYVSGTNAFWRQFSGARAASRLRGKWLRAPSGTGQFQSFSSLTDLHALLSQLLAGHGKLVKGARSSIRGRPAIALRDTDREGTLYVAATGTPYPLRLVNASATGGRLDFSEFDAPVQLRAPRPAIDVASLQK